MASVRASLPFRLSSTSMCFLPCPHYNITARYLGEWLCARVSLPLFLRVLSWAFVPVAPVTARRCTERREAISMNQVRRARCKSLFPRLPGGGRPSVALVPDAACTGCPIPERCGADRAAGTGGRGRKLHGG